MQFQFFDREADLSISYRRLPHWDQPGVLCFITWRTIDSIPQSQLRRWRVERAAWLRTRGIDPLTEDWRDRLHRLPRADRQDFHERFTQAWMNCLDRGYGDCLLKQPRFAAVVAESLHHGDQRRYSLSDFVVMPNHVHVLVELPDAGQVKAQPRRWKHFTAARINRMRNRSERFWQVESFDHLVRSEEQFEFLRQYIAHNPQVAGLSSGEFLAYTRPK